MREIPEQTRQVACAAFPHGSLAMRVRESVGTVFADAEFADLFAKRGHPALSPAFLAMVSVLQYTEGLTDRQAADAVRGRLDWKYCLSLELTDSGFDASVLSEFRSRLVTGEHTDRLLSRVLEVLAAHDLLGPGSRQRTDATHVVADLRLLNRLELVVETMRATLEALAAAAPGWLAAHTRLDWWDRYARRASDYRLPQVLPARDELFRTVGQDGLRLLESAYGDYAPDWLREIPAVQVLRQVWVQQYVRDPDGRPRARESKDLPPGSVSIGSPYDAEARYGIKRGMAWRGYKAHFTETCRADRPRLIVHVGTTEASRADVETTAARHTALEAAGLKPDQELVDAAYVSIDHILTAQRHGIELTGPLPPDSGWQARDPDAFDRTHFAIDFDNQHVTCPNGKQSRYWREAHSRDGLPIVQVTFRLPDCTPCPDRARCTRSERNARAMTFRPREQFEAQQRIRADQATDEWKERYALRAGVEGTMAQASSRCGIHRARYRGLARTHLQHVLTAIALNFVRTDAWLTGIPLASAWTSRLTRLHATLAATL
ncbi:IS1182 family transposase [Streptomyces violascens]|uniref:IS1182 family transposase n=1 Tax=Streptomyces violascens TaxID=67381 RepID=UPI0036817196